MSCEGQGSALSSVRTGTQATAELSAPCHLMVWMKRVVLPSRVAGDFQQQGSSEAIGLDKGQERKKPRVEKPEGMRKGLLLSKL